MRSAECGVRNPADVPAISQIEFRISNFEFRRAAFSLVELMVVMTLLSLIVLALMAVFNSTQQAFRASVTQTDVLEGSRTAVELITTDLRGLTPSGGFTPSSGPGSSTNFFYNGYFLDPVNFFATNNNNDYVNNFYEPLLQSLPGSSVQRTNLLQYFFVLGRENTKWTGTGYAVNSGSASPLYPLYRFYAETNVNANPVGLYYDFLNTVYAAQWTNMSHLMDGVVHLAVRAFDTNGMWMTNGYNFNQRRTFANTWFSQPVSGEVGFCMYSNMVPATVELQLGVLEDRALERAESLGIAGQPPSTVTAQWNYLQNQSGKVHLFRQRVTIQNVDISAYQ
jgi:type II secretory pathway component PulJ